VSRLSGSHWRRWVVLAMVLCLGTIAVTEAAAAPAAENKPYGGTFRWAYSGPETMNMFVTILEAGLMISRLMYESLIDYDEDFNYVPGLATEWSASPDGLQWTFRLTDQAKWHDGRPLTAEDVKFTFDFIKEYELGTFAAYVDSIAEVTVPQPDTVVFRLEEPLATFLFNIRNVLILPKHVWGGFSSRDEVMAFPNEPVMGSGPWKFGEWKKGQFLRLVANTEYWRGRPYLDTLVLIEFQNDEAAVQALRAGEVDGVREVPPSLVSRLTQDPRIKVVSVPSFWFTEVIINSLEGGKGNPLLFDPAVRQALAHAVDKQFLVDTVLYGYGQPGLSVISPANEKWFNASLNDYPFDLDKARAILEAAGYLDRDADGVREGPRGQRLEFRFNIMSDAAAFRAAQFLSEWWAKVGIKATPIMTEDLGALVYVDDDGDGVVDHNFDLLIWNWSGDPDPEFNLMTMICAQIGSWQDVGYCNPEYDQLYEEQRRAVDDAQRQRLVWRMQELLLRDLPYIVLWSPMRVQAYRADLFDGPVLMVDGMLSKLNVQTSRTLHLVQAPAVPEEPTAAPAAGANLPWLVAIIALVVAAVALARARRATTR